MDNVTESTELPEQSEVSEAIEQPQEQQEVTEKAKPDGYEQIDFKTATPEQIEARFNRVFGQLKFSQKDLSEFRKIAREQSAIINELRQGQTQIVNHLKNDDFSRAESSLVQQQKEAYERGDLEGFNNASVKLNEILIERKLSEKLQKSQPQVQQQDRPVSGYDVVMEAVQEGHITHEDASAYSAWASETDQYGNLKRPWINNQDIRNSAAAMEGSAVFSNPQYSNLTFAQKLAEIDKRMGIQNRNTQQSVMSSGTNLTRNQKSNTIKLSPEIERLAVRTRFAGPGKSNAEHIEAYKKQIQEVRGSRK